MKKYEEGSVGDLLMKAAEKRYAEEEVERQRWIADFDKRKTAQIIQPKIPRNKILRAIVEGFVAFAKALNGEK